MAKLIKSKDKSIQLISKNKDGQLFVDENGLNEIKKIKGDIGICLIVGPYRQGKSFLMNRLIGESCNAFEISHKDNSCTKGIWINKEPVKVSKSNKEELNILFADTEGLESDECDESWDAKLFLLSLAISSMFIYNTKNALANDAFNKLSVMTVLSEKIKIRSNSTKAFNTMKLKNDCPDFVWVVRDYSLEEEMSPIDRLNKFLKKEKEDSSSKIINETKKRNEIKESMANSFHSLNCFYLSIPEYVGKEKKSIKQTLMSLNEIEFNDLCDEFRGEFKQIRDYIYDKIQAKAINNHRMNGVLFADYLKKVLDLINSDKAINLHDTLLASIESVALSFFEEAKKDYLAKMDGKFKNNSQPTVWSQFYAFEQTLSKNCLESMKSNIYGSEQLGQDYIEKFEKFRNEKLKLFKLDNEKLCNDFNKTIFEEAKKKFTNDMKQFMADNQAKKWTDFDNNEQTAYSNCVKTLKDKIILNENESIDKYINDFKAFKEIRSYDNSLIGGQLLEFFRQNEARINDKTRRDALDTWNKMNMNRKYDSKNQFRVELENYKSKIKAMLIEPSDFDKIWEKLKTELNIEGIENNIVEIQSSKPAQTPQNEYPFVQNKFPGFNTGACKNDLLPFLGNANSNTKNKSNHLIIVNKYKIRNLFYQLKYFYLS
jgi:ABC-type uncharacterized transport system YnjBCD ATPase subunit